MKYNFKKISATGNDFIIVDNRDGIFLETTSDAWQNLCMRKTGIGADGVLFLENSKEYDFSMRYLNADGGEVAMCGNGARALSYFANQFGTGLKDQTSYVFSTQNGVYNSTVSEDGFVKVQMTEVYDEGAHDLSDFNLSENHYYINTGVAHCVFEAKNLGDIDLNELSRKVRHDERFEEGSNVNFFEMTKEHSLSLRTFEKGVEDETYACGTGAVATALFASRLYSIDNYIDVKMDGGILKIEFNSDRSKIYLGGNVHVIYSGVFLKDLLFL